MEKMVKYLKNRVGTNVATLKSSFARYDSRYGDNEYYKETNNTTPDCDVLAEEFYKAIKRPP